MKTGRVEDGGPESGKRVDGGTEKRELPLPWAPRSGNHWEGIGGRIKRERRVSKKRGSMIGVGSDRNREDEGKAAHQTRQLPLAPLFIHPRTSHFPVSPESFSPFPHRPSVCPTLLSYLSHPIIPSVVPVLHFVRYIFVVHSPSLTVRRSARNFASSTFCDAICAYILTHEYSFGNI